MENFGVLKTSVDFATVDIYFNHANLKRDFNALVSRVKLKKETACKTENCKKKLDAIIEDLHKGEEELNYLTTPKGQSRKRVKRWDALGSGLKYFTGVLDSEDGRTFNEALSNLNNAQNHVSSEIEEMRQKLEEIAKTSNLNHDNLAKPMSENVQKKILELEEKVSSEIEVHDIDELSRQARTYKEKLQSLISTIVTRKLDVKLFSLQSIEERIKIAKASLDSETYELAYSSAIECMKQLEINSVVTSNEVRFTMNIPVVHKKSFELLKFIKSPSKVDNFILVFNPEWQFISKDGDKIHIISNLEDCVEAPDKVFICDAIQTLELNNSACLSNIVASKTVDLSLCADFLLLAESPETVMLVNEADELWFRADEQEVVEIDCEESKTNVSIHGVGFIKLNQNCVLSSGEDQHKLAVTKRNMTSSSFMQLVNLDLLTKFKKDSVPMLEDAIYNLDSFAEIAIYLSDVLNKSVASEAYQEFYQTQYFQEVLLILIALVPALTLLIMFLNHQKTMKNPKKIGAKNIDA